MPVVNTAVLLFAFPLGQKLVLKGDPPWYTKYFFSPVDGHAAYWTKQTATEIALDGEVFDWAVVDDPNPPINFLDRTQVINTAIASLEQDRGLSFGKFDLIICVLGVPASLKPDQVDGGSCTATTADGSRAGIVTRVGDSFDFIAHEIGHAINLNHSYGDPKYKNASWSQFGEYGHPWCVMSAVGYGGIGGAYVPASPKDGRSEYSGLGPSLNAASALGRGWVDSVPWNLAAGQVSDIVLRARGWQGRNAQLPPQAIEVRAADGKTYVLEFREATGWDKGQATPRIIVNAGKGSTADVAHPNTFSATYGGEITLPITFGGSGSVFNGFGFGVEVLDRSLDDHTVTLRLRPGRVGVTDFVLAVQHHTLQASLIARGTTTWAPGEKLCVEGTWAYRKEALSQEAILEATYALASAPISSAWTVDGISLDKPSGSILLKSKTVQVANPKLLPETDKRWVTVRYQIDPLPTGSRLHLFNDPAGETFTVDVATTLSTPVGSARGEEFVKFTGMVYLYPPEFFDEMDACIANFERIGRDYVRYKAVLPPDLWKRVPGEQVSRVEALLNAVAALHGDEQRRHEYRQAVSELAELVGERSVEPTLISTKERLHLHGMPPHREPAGPGVVEGS